MSSQRLSYTSYCTQSLHTSTTPLTVYSLCIQHINVRMITYKLLERIIAEKKFFETIRTFGFP